MSSVTRFDKNSPLGKSLEVFGKFLTVYFLFGKMLSLLWQTCDIIGQIFVVANSQMLKNNLIIWSHWLRCFFKRIFLSFSRLRRAKRTNEKFRPILMDEREKLCGPFSDRFKPRSSSIFDCTKYFFRQKRKIGHFAQRL